MSMVGMQLITVELGLAFHCKTGMNLPGTNRRTALTVARENGWTHKQTNRGALLDIIAFRRVNDPEYYPTQHVLDSMNPADVKKVPGIIKKADKLVEKMNAWKPGDEQVEWRGTDSLRGL
jgi:hypothetical protein